MSSPDPIISRKWALNAHGRRNVFIWGRQERSVHTLMKAFLWALYLPQYPTLTVEVRIEDRYKPDLVAMPTVLNPYVHRTDPLFWGECGMVGKEKIHTLARKYRQTHLVISKWDTSLHNLTALVQEALHGVERSAPFDLIQFPPDSHRRFIDPDTDTLHIRHDDLDWVRM